jgi:hypothetical protein
MKVKGGYFFRILDVDLTRGETSIRPFDEDFALKYIGGRGFGAKLLADHIGTSSKRIDPLGPENILVIAPGPLTGTYLPASGKNSFVTLSPATGIYGDSSMGGMFGVELRQAGYDAVILRGRTPELSALSIADDRVEIIPMPETRGVSTLEAESMVREVTGDEDMKIAAIGVAGENCAVYSCVNADWSRNAGRIGIGAVMGSKNLKAIAVRGSRDLPVADLPNLVQVAKEGYDHLKSHEFFRFWQQQGLMSVVDYANTMGILPTRNFQQTVFEKADRMNGYTMEDRYKIGDSACFGCSMSCGNICLVKEGKYRGTVTEGPEYESAAMLGSNLGASNFAYILKANALCDDLGLDTISTGSVVGSVIEGLQKGILSPDDLDGRNLEWGDEEGTGRGSGTRWQAALWPSSSGGPISRGSCPMSRDWSSRPMTPAPPSPWPSVMGLRTSAPTIQGRGRWLPSWRTGRTGGWRRRRISSSTIRPSAPCSTCSGSAACRGSSSGSRRSTISATTMRSPVWTGPWKNSWSVPARSMTSQGLSMSTWVLPGGMTIRPDGPSMTRFPPGPQRTA